MAAAADAAQCSWQCDFCARVCKQEDESIRCPVKNRAGVQCMRRACLNCLNVGAFITCLCEDKETWGCFQHYTPDRLPGGLWECELESNKFFHCPDCIERPDLGIYVLPEHLCPCERRARELPEEEEEEEEEDNDDK